MDKPNEIASTTIRIAGGLVTILGIAHLVVGATIEPAKIAGLAPPTLLRDYIIWFQAFGACILLMGLLGITCSEGLRKGSHLAWKIAVLTSLCMFATGSAGTIIFHVAPPNLLLLAGGAGLAALAASRRTCQVGT